MNELLLIVTIAGSRVAFPAAKVESVVELDTLSQVPRAGTLALVLGNEEAGLPRDLAAACGMRLTLPGSGAVESLNVSVAAAVLIHALSGG